MDLMFFPSFVFIIAIDNFFKKNFKQKLIVTRHVRLVALALVLII